MSQYLLSTYAVEGEVAGASGTPDEMQAFIERVMAVEDEMDAEGAFFVRRGVAQCGVASVSGRAATAGRS